MRPRTSRFKPLGLAVLAPAAERGRSPHQRGIMRNATALRVGALVLVLFVSAPESFVPRTVADAQAQLGRFRDQFYQHKRIHSAPGYLTPAEFESQWRAQQAQQKGGHSKP